MVPSRLQLYTLASVTLAVFALWSVGCSSIRTGAGFIGEISNARPADVIIVLGSGLENDGSPGVALQRRSLRAAEAFRLGLADRVLCTGGRTGMARRTEADACRELLVAEGVPAESVLLEEASRSTEQNAVNARSIMQILGFQSAVIVTDSFHMARASWMFTNLGVTHTRFPVPRRFLEETAYRAALSREITALQWYAVKNILGISITDPVFD